MSIMKKAIENSKKLAKVGIKMIPKKQEGEVVKEPEEEIEEGPEVEESEEEEVEEEIKEDVPEPLKKEIKYVIGEIRTYAKEVGYAVTDVNGQPIECKDYAQAILVSQAIKNEKTTAS